jgi:hypothetical protein
MKILKDTREKTGWHFPFYEEIVVRDIKLDTGDYTTEILKDIIVVERKASVSEIAINLGKKKNKDRIYREFERMRALEKAFIVCEFPESEVYLFPEGQGFSAAQKAKIKMSGRFIRKLLREIEVEFPNIEVVFCDNKAEAEFFTHELFLEWENKYV